MSHNHVSSLRDRLQSDGALRTRIASARAAAVRAELDDDGIAHDEISDDDLELVVGGMLSAFNRGVV
ncbi:MAG: hypothetical protein AAGF73_16975 [Actinomycetota bacterium]